MGDWFLAGFGQIAIIRVGVLGPTDERMQRYKGNITTHFVW